jgi:predicted transcriptional regulator of viral defense system
MDFLTLQKKIQELNLEIFTLNDLIKITEQTKEVVKSKLTILVKKKRMYRLKKGYYSLHKIENKFQLQKIYKNTYIALQSALEYYESTTQRFNNLDLITKNNLLDQEINNTKINFHKVKKELFTGFEKIEINNTEVFISSIEKTIIDCTYFSSKTYLTEINNFIKKFKNKINTELITIMLHKINSSTLNKRIGYLLELNNITITNVHINNKYEKLNSNKSEKGTKNKKWKLIINEDI